MFILSRETRNLAILVTAVLGVGLCVPPASEARADHRAHRARGHAAHQSRGHQHRSSRPMSAGSTAHQGHHHRTPRAHVSPRTRGSSINTQRNRSIGAGQLRTPNRPTSRLGSRSLRPGSRTSNPTPPLLRQPFNQRSRLRTKRWDGSSGVTVDDLHREGSNAGDALSGTGEVAQDVGVGVLEGFVGGASQGQGGGQQGQGTGTETSTGTDDEQGDEPAEVAGAFFNGDNGVSVPDVGRRMQRIIRNKLPW